MTASLHGNVANQIFQQVEQMIQKAKKDSEARVRYELTSARSQLQGMETIIGELGERVARCTRANGLGTSDQLTVDRNFLNQKIQQLEQKWGSEVKALKQDLHRTILAHNHNSDLMRHHRDALDEARRKLDTMTQPKAEQVDAQIDKVDRMLRHGQAKQKELETLAQRLSSLEHQVSEIMPSGMPPFAGIMPGMNALLAQQAAAQRGEAAAAAAAPKRASKKEASPAVPEPSDEEMRRLLYMQMAAAKGGRPNNLDPEAPIFVPKAPDASSSPAEGAAKAEDGDEAAAAKAEDDDEEDAGAAKAEEGDEVVMPKAEEGDEAAATKAEEGEEAGAAKAEEVDEAGTAKAEEGEEVPPSDTVD